MLKPEYKIKILVACHKSDTAIYQNDIYMPIQVRKALHANVELGFQCDNTGDNISEKNDSYCELTAIYWAWKNLKDIDYIGLCHYRRYFDFFKKHYQSSITVKTNPLHTYKHSNKLLIEKLDNVDIALAKPISNPYNLFQDYASNHNGLDMKVIEKIIADLYPDYVNSFREIIYFNNNISPYNMFVMRWELFDNYCNWLFSILNRAEKDIDITSYNPYQKRIWGFIAERLLNVYVEYQNSTQNNLKINHYSVLLINDDKTPESKIKTFIRNLRYKISFALTTPRQR